MSRRSFNGLCLLVSFILFYKNAYASPASDGKHLDLANIVGQPPPVNAGAKDSVKIQRAENVVNSRQENEVDKHNVQENQAAAPGPPAPRHPPLQPNQGGLLADSLACSEEIARYCANTLRTSDILVLQCLQDAGDDVLSDGCQQELWNVKFNLTHDDRFRQAAYQYCSAELQQYPCAQPTTGVTEPSHLVLCLVEHKLNMTNKVCQNFLTRIEAIMFTDFNLVGRFARTCKADVERLNCGQGHFAPSVRQQIQQKTKVIHSQGGTLECLLRKIVESAQDDAKLAPECRHEVLRLAEMQADDFNLDRPLFFACRDDRERFCRDVQAGNGRVYSCLIENLAHRQMTFECREAVVFRMRLMQRDYKLSHALVVNCQSAIEENQCTPKGLDEESDHFYLTYVLLCLEKAAKDKKVIPLHCQNQVTEHRRLIVTEARMQPEMVLACSRDIELHCRQLTGGGETLHCLMGVAKRPPTSEYAGLSNSCFQAISHLLKVADVGSDYQVDQVLYRDCKGVIEGVCKKEAATEPEVLSCMMNNVESPLMTDECEERLLEIQYFLARDFSLDPQLYHACKVDAEQKCHYADDWTKPVSRGKTSPQQGPNPGYLVLTCLYRHAYEDEENSANKLSEDCTSEVRRVMHERAVSVHLMPHIEEACRSDLAEHCSQRTKPGDEWMCLQEKLNSLSRKCKDEVKNFTSMQAKDSRLDRVLNRACKPVIEEYCKDLLSRDFDNGEVTECLIRNKGVPEMSKKCRVYINHVELMSMQDYELSFKFNHACQRDIKNNCLTGSKTDKVSVIRCLSEILVHRTLLNEGPEISLECKKQMKMEYFKLDSVSMAAYRKVDSKFVDACKADLSTYKCDEEESVEKAMECLKEHKPDLNVACKKYIFKRERLEFGDNTFDVTLNRACSHEIRLFCQLEEKQHVLHCLFEHMTDPQMSSDCLLVVEKRLREQASDVRLQPVLYKHCLPDINEYCKAGLETLKKQERQHNEEELQAVIITCLRETLISGKRLAARCQQEVKRVIYESEIDPQLDPPFYTKCKQDIKRLCEDAVMARDGHDGIMECMKVKYKDHLISGPGCIKEMERKMKELLFDIHLDEALYQACQLDVKHHCNDILAGNGNQLKCLIMASNSNNVKMSENCKSKLIDRQLLWKSFVNDEDFKVPEGLGDFASLITASPSKNYLLTTLMIIVVVIFAVGLLFGRVTKRIRREIKNR